MPSIAIIKPNSLRYNEENMIKSNFTTEKIEEALEDFIIYKKINNNDELMETIITELSHGLSAESFNNLFAIHTGVISHINDELYQLCHIYVTRENHEAIINNNIKYNGIASYLSDTNIPVFGTAIMFKIDTIADGNTLQYMNDTHVYQQFINKFIHQGCIINIDTNSNINEYTYVFNPVDWVSPNEITNYKYVETELLGKIIMLFYDTSVLHNETNINKFASDIYGSSLYGRIIVGLRDKPSDLSNDVNSYIDLDKKTLISINRIICDKQSRSLTDEEDNNLQVCKDGKRIYNNFHKILQRRLTKSINVSTI